METLESFAIIIIAIVCWAFCTGYVFLGMYDDNVPILYKLAAFAYSMIIGWVVAPIRLAIELNDFINKEDK